MIRRPFVIPSFHSPNPVSVRIEKKALHLYKGIDKAPFSMAGHSAWGVFHWAFSRSF